MNLLLLSSLERMRDAEETAGFNSEQDSKQNPATVLIVPHTFARLSDLASWFLQEACKSNWVLQNDLYHVE